MSGRLRGLAPLVAAGLSLLILSQAQAGELDRRLRQLEAPATPPLSLDAGLDAAETSRLDDDAVVQQDLALIEDFHPETDRWTDRNNRIRVSLWSGAWLFSGELDIHHDVPVGFRIAWEVPGFIGLRWDSGFVPWSRLEVKVGGNNNSRYMEGWVHNHTLSLGIFNPELSVDGLAFWAGFGGGVWVYSYDEEDIVNGVDGTFDDMNISGHIFVELDYKIVDVFHISFGIRQHFLLADHTDEGRFYELNGQEQSFDTGRNDGMFDDLAAVSEFTISLSVLF